MPRSGMALSTFLGAVALLAGAQAASAETVAHPEAGVLRLPNVRIEVASPSQIAAASRAGTNPSQAGLRAYKDPETGELRDQTPEEMMEAGGTAKAGAARAAKSAFASPQGGIIIPLDDSFMSNSVVSKDAAGKIHMQCVTGDDAAHAALDGKAGKAQRHDH
jgi:hypothetical protein